MAEALFEIPESVREVSEQNLKHAHAAYDQLMNFVIDAWLAAMPSLAAGFKEVHGRAMLFARENADEAFAFSSHLSNAETLSEILELQTQFAQDRMQAFTAQAQELFSLIECALQKVEGGEVATGMRNFGSDPTDAALSVDSFKKVKDGVRAAR